MLGPALPFAIPYSLVEPAPEPASCAQSQGLHLDVFQRPELVPSLDEPSLNAEVDAARHRSLTESGRDHMPPAISCMPKLNQIDNHDTTCVFFCVCVERLKRRKTSTMLNFALLSVH